MAMSSRDRVLAALNHEEPDRVPLFIGTSGATTVLGPGYVRLAEHLGIRTGPIRWLSRPLQYTWMDEEVMERVHDDIGGGGAAGDEDVAREYGVIDAVLGGATDTIMDAQRFRRAAGAAGRALPAPGAREKRRPPRRAAGAAGGIPVRVSRRRDGRQRHRERAAVA